MGAAQVNTFNDGLTEQERHDVGLCGNNRHCLPCAREAHEKAGVLDVLRLRAKNKKLFNVLLEVKALLPADMQARVEDVLKGEM